MCNNNKIVMQKILSLDTLIASLKRNNRNSASLKRCNQLIQNLKGMGLIEGTGLPGGSKGRYFLIDGESWQKACKELRHTIVPNFIMWEEIDFFSFLESLIKKTS